MFEIEKSTIALEEIKRASTHIRSFSKKISSVENKLTGTIGEEKCADMIIKELESKKCACKKDAFSSFSSMGRGSFPQLIIWFVVGFFLYLVSLFFTGLPSLLLTLIALIVFVIGCIVTILMFFGVDGLKTFFNKRVSHNVVSECVAPHYDSSKDERVCIVTANHDDKLGGYIRKSNNLRKAVSIIVPITIAAFIVICILKMIYGVSDVLRLALFISIPSAIMILGIVAVVLQYAPLSKIACTNNGLATSLALETYLYFVNHKEILQDNTRLIFVSFGGENSNHSGSSAFLKFYPQYHGANVLCIEDIVGPKIQVLTKDPIRKITYSKKAMSMVRSCEHHLGVDTNLNFGSSIQDIRHAYHGYISNSFAKAKCDTVSIYGEDSKLSLGEENIDKLFCVCVGTIKRFIEDDTPIKKDQSSRNALPTIDIQEIKKR